MDEGARTMTIQSYGVQGVTRGSKVKGQEGIALFTVLALLIIMTVLGIGALTISGMENRMAGFMRTSGVSAAAAESCLNTSVQIIRHMLAKGTLPTAFEFGNGGPIVNRLLLEDELKGFSQNDPDTYAGTAAAPNLNMTVNNHQVWGDIDRLFNQPKPGGQVKFGYGGSTDILYRVDCLATNLATGMASRRTAVYKCDFMSDGCLNPL